MSEKFLSTTAISKKLGIEASDLFIILQRLNWIVRNDDKWNLTKEGEKIGGHLKKDEKFGEYIVWPETLPIDSIKSAMNESNHNLLTASAVAEIFKTTPQKIVLAPI